MFLLILFLITIFGVQTLLIFGIRRSLLPLMPLGFLVGSGFFTLIVFVLNLLGVRFSNINFFIILLTLNFSLGLLVRKFKSELKIGRKELKLQKIEWLFVMLILVCLGSSLINNLYWPVRGWDAISLYDFRAMVFSATGFMHETAGNSLFYVYPPYTSLLHTINYLTNFAHPGVFYSLILICFCFECFLVVKDFTNRFLAIVSVALILATSDFYTQSLISYANLPYSVFLLLSIVYLLIWKLKQDSGYLLLSAVLLGMSYWTRSVEPFYFINFITLLLWIIIERKYKKLKLIFLYVVIFLVFMLPWRYFLALNSAVTTESLAFGSILNFTLIAKIFSVSNMQNILMAINQQVIKSDLWLFVLSFCFILNSLQQRRDWYFSSIIVITFAIFAVGLVAFTIIVPDWLGIPDSLRRMSMFLNPLLVVYCFKSGYDFLTAKEA